MLTAACAAIQKERLPPPKSEGVKLSRKCEQMAKQQQFSSLQEGEDAEAKAIERGVIIDNANAVIAAVGDCSKNQRQGFAGTK